MSGPGGSVAQEPPQPVLRSHATAPPALALGFYSLPFPPYSPSILTSLILQDFVEPLQRCLLLRIQVLRRDGVAQLRWRGLPRESSSLAPSQGSRQSLSERMVKAGRRKTREAGGSATARYRGAPIPIHFGPRLGAEGTADLPQAITWSGSRQHNHAQPTRHWGWG